MNWKPLNVFSCAYCGIISSFAKSHFRRMRTGGICYPPAATPRNLWWWRGHRRLWVCCDYFHRVLTIQFFDFSIQFPFYYYYFLFIYLFQLFISYKFVLVAPPKFYLTHHECLLLSLCKKKVAHLIEYFVLFTLAEIGFLEWNNFCIYRY